MNYTRNYDQELCELYKIVCEETSDLILRIDEIKECFNFIIGLIIMPRIDTSHPDFTTELFLSPDNCNIESIKTFRAKYNNKDISDINLTLSEYNLCKDQKLTKILSRFLKSNSLPPYNIGDCQNYMMKLKNPMLEQSFSQESEHIIANHKRKIKNLIIGIASLCVVISVLVMSLGWLFLQTFESINEEYMTIKTEDYGNWDGHIEGERQYLQSGLYIFPEKINTAKDSNYYYYCSYDNSSISKYLILAEVSYEEEVYLKEKERLAGIQCQVQLSPSEGSITNKISYSETLFSYPAYVATYASNLSYEYALLDEE